MLNRMRKILIVMLAGIMMFTLLACGNNKIEDGNTENPIETESETETEVRIEITDATEILTKVWELYETEDTDGNRNNDKFAIMGGHFETATMDMPAKYDLTKTTDLVQMYCVPESEVPNIDDAATMIDLYNAGKFTAGAYHVSEMQNMKNLIGAIELQISGNQWHGETPEKFIIIEIEEYVVVAYGRETLVDTFEKNLVDIYKKMVHIAVEQYFS